MNIIFCGKINKNGKVSSYEKKITVITDGGSSKYLTVMSQEEYNSFAKLSNLCESVKPSDEERRRHKPLD